MKKITDLKWWESFLEETNNFSRTAVIKNVIDKELVEKLNHAVLDGLKNRILTKDAHGLRIYFPDRDKRKEYDDFIETLFKTPPLADETIESYSDRVFKERFGLILNFYERHSDFISDEIRNIVNPLLEIIGVPATGIDVTVFIGNYGWTPLGIHQDHIGENVVHFHLGPANKTMYTWDEEKYKELTNTKHNNFDIEPLLKHSDEYEFSTGDIFYMPWNKFHIGKTDELSVGVTLWFNNPTKVRYFDKIMNTFYTSYVENNTEVLPPFSDYINSKEPFETFLNIFKENEKDKFLGLTVKDFFEYLLDEYKYSLISNGGWQAIPLSRKELEKYDVNEYSFLEKKNIVGNKYFKILYILNEEEKTISAFVRGSKIKTRYSEELIEIINRLNTSEKISVEELLSSSGKDWPKEASLYFLSMIYDKRGFELVE